MTPALPPPCQAFDDLAEELALGMVEEPRRSELLDHAAGCPRCRATLDGLGSVVDRLLLVAPEVEPPTGFESRVLARLTPATMPARRRVPIWAAAAAAVLLLVGGLGAGVLLGRDGSSTSRLGDIVSPDGDTIGSVQLLERPTPHVLVTITAPRPIPGVRHCELLVSNGTWVEVGTWDVADMAAGVWAVGVSTEQLAATAMRVVDDAGRVLASARLDEHPPSLNRSADGRDGQIGGRRS